MSIALAEQYEENGQYDKALEEYKKFSPLFESDLYEFISLENCAAKRISRGGTGLGSVEKQIEIIKNQLKTEN